MRIHEVVKGAVKASGARRRSKSRIGTARTDFEKNVCALRSKERKLKPQRPVPPVKHA